MTTEIDHDLDTHEAGCTTSNVLSLQVVRTDDPAKPLTVDVDSHLHGMAEIEFVISMLGDVQEQIAMTTMQGLAEQAARSADPAAAAAMLTALVGVLTGTEDGPAGE